MSDKNNEDAMKIKVQELELQVKSLQEVVGQIISCCLNEIGMHNATTMINMMHGKDSK